MPHLESKTKLIMTASVNKYINPKKYTWIPTKLSKIQNDILRLIENILQQDGSISKKQAVYQPIIQKNVR
jgi:ERCC4-related helicase